MSPVKQFINMLAITITFLLKITGVWEAFSHSFLWGHFQLCLYYCSSTCAATEPSDFSIHCLIPAGGAAHQIIGNTS